MTRPGPASSEQVAEAIKHPHDLLNRICQPLYAVLDSARDGRILPLLENSGCEYRILYSRRLALSMDGMGPHLIALRHRSPLLLNLLEKGWGNSWGIFLTSSSGLPALLRHLRRLLPVKLPGGKQALFRFYDPRVLHNYLPGNDAAEIDQFFGPITSIFLEAEPRQEQFAFIRVVEFTREIDTSPNLIRHLH